MMRRRWWFIAILGCLLSIFITTSVLPVIAPPVYAQGVFGRNRDRSSNDDNRKKQEEKDKSEKEQKAKEQADRDRQAREQADRDRQAREQAEKERWAKEQADRERKARENQERAQREQQERERKQREERERQEREQQEKDRQERQKKEQEQAERDRQAREQQERERQTRERNEREQQQRDQAAREQQERDRQAKEQADKDRQAKERANQQQKQEENRPPQINRNKQVNEQPDNSRRPEPREQADRDRAVTDRQPTDYRPSQEQNSNNKSGGKFERVEERPKRPETREPGNYRPDRDHYPYDPGYHRDNHTIYYPTYPPTTIPEPLPVPMPGSVPTDDAPGEIIIDRGPTDRPLPEPPSGDESLPDDVTPSKHPNQGKPGKDKVADVKPLNPNRKPPVIPAELKKPVKRGSGDEALRDISIAWYTTDIKPIKKHVNLKTPVRVYNKGIYSHKISGKEFIELTEDAFTWMDTRSFSLKPISFKYGKVFASGSHTYIGSDSEVKKTLLNYTLKRVAGVWTIVEVGFSPDKNSDVARE